MTDLPPVLKSAPFSVQFALEQNVRRSRLRRDDLHAPFRGTRSLAQIESHSDRAHAFASIMRTGQVFSHGTAAVLWGFWLPTRLEMDELIDVTSIGPSRPVRMRGVRGHHAETGSLGLTVRDGLPVTTATDTLRALSPLLTLGELTEAGDSLVRRKNPLATIDEVHALISRHAGQRGSRALAAAIPLVRAGCDSPRETRLRLLLLDFGFPEPVVNAVVSKMGAEKRRFGDMVYLEWMVIVEYDGEYHWKSAAQRAADIDRREQLVREGWLIVQVVSAHMTDPSSIARRVNEALRSRGWRPKRGSKSRLLLEN